MAFLIPEAKREAVARALEQTFGVAAADDMTLLTGGLSSAFVVKILVKDRPYVLRIVMRLDFFNNPARQFICMKLAADEGIAPPVLYSNDEEGISITGFIEATPPVGIPLLPHLVNMIRNIHALPLFPAHVGSLEGVDTYVEQYKAAALLPESATEEVFRYYSEIQRAYPRHDPDLVSSHNDLNPNNILFDGQRLWVIDWDAAFANDRYVDLAIVANNFVTTDEAEESFLSGYFLREPTVYERARFFLMRQACHVCFATLFLKLAAEVMPAGEIVNSDMTAPGLKDFYILFRTGRVALDSFEGKLLYAKVLLNETLRMMKSPRFAESVARMRQ